METPDPARTRCAEISGCTAKDGSLIRELISTFRHHNKKEPESVDLLTEESKEKDRPVAWNAEKGHSRGKNSRKNSGCPGDTGTA